MISTWLQLVLNLASTSWPQLGLHLALAWPQLGLKMAPRLPQDTPQDEMLRIFVGKAKNLRNTKVFQCFFLQHEGFRMFPSWPTQAQNDLNLASTWPQLGLNLASTWLQLGLNMASTWAQRGLNLASTWPQDGRDIGPRQPSRHPPRRKVKDCIRTAKNL